MKISVAAGTGIDLDLVASPVTCSWGDVEPNLGTTASPDSIELTIVDMDWSRDAAQEESLLVSWHTAGSHGPSFLTDRRDRWKREIPLPAADSLFELDLRFEHDALALVGRPDARRQRVVETLRSRHVQVETRDTLTWEVIERFSVIALLGDPGGEINPVASTVMAAGRLLIMPEVSTTRGLLPDIDHLSYHFDDELASAADSVLSHQSAYRPVRVMARISAEMFRASQVYHQAAIDSLLFSHSGGGAKLEPALVTAPPQGEH